MTKAQPLSILVVGSGGREHALVRKCLASPLARRVAATPGNGGIADDVACFGVADDDVDGLVRLARDEAFDLVVVGPEVPLGLGLVDALAGAGIPAFGPGREAARLESSKAYCKDFLRRHGIPTARYAHFTDLPSALRHIEAQPVPMVVKASGLAAGKGVVIARTREEAADAARDMLEGGAFGESGREIVIEECLEGPEISVHAIVSAGRFVCLPASRDHKRVGEGDTGANTGGMGAYAPTAEMTEALAATVGQTILQPVIDGLRSEGIDYRGVLYAGLMLTAEGPKVLEFNVRFGDPETQVVLPMVADDLVPVFRDVAAGAPPPETVRCHPGAAMVVVVASEGYPGAYAKDVPLELPGAPPPDTAIYHAGTYRDADGYLRSKGGRVLGVAARAKTLREAAETAYGVCDAIDFRAKYFRRDIGHRELDGAEG